MRGEYGFPFHCFERLRLVDASITALESDRLWNQRATWLGTRDLVQHTIADVAARFVGTVDTSFAGAVLRFSPSPHPRPMLPPFLLLLLPPPFSRSCEGHP